MTIITPKSTDNAIPVEGIGRTPAGKIAAETPKAILPSVAASYGPLFALLGDPETRYGRLATGAGNVSIPVKLRMLSDEVIAFTLAYIGAKLVAAEYEIRCADPKIAAFFKAMYSAFHREFMLQASMAVGLGCAGLIKKTKFAAPDPEDPTDLPVWTGDATPLICEGFRQVYPLGAYPCFDDDGKFDGFTYSKGKVDRLYALWLTIGRHRAFGNYWGHGRLDDAYKAWWIDEFGDDQLVVHIQKFVDAIVMVSYPDGVDDEPDPETGSTDNVDTAISIGNKMRGGATVAMPSNVYSVIDPATGGERMTAIRQWSAEILRGAENIDAFNKLADQMDTRKAMGMLLPLQAYQAVKQSALGGPTTSDVLGELAVSLLLMDAAAIDEHLNRYLFPYLLEANFGPDAPRVTKVTTGLRESDRGELFEVVRILAAKMDSDLSARIDGERLLDELSIPQQAYVPPPAEQAETPPAEQAEAPTGQAQRQRGHSAYDPNKNPPADVIEKILAERVRPTLPQEAEYTEADIARIVAQLREDVPEVANLDTVEVGG